MPKHSRNEDEDSDAYIQRKMRKIEKKLLRRKRRSNRVDSLSSDPDASPIPIFVNSPVPSTHEDGQELLMVNPIPLLEPIEQPSLTTQNVVFESVPDTSTSVPEKCVIDDDIMQILGVYPNKTKNLGPKIQKDLAVRWEHVAVSGVTKEVRKDLLHKYATPENYQKIAAPLLNPEIKAALSYTMIGKDKSIEDRQKQVTSAISCIGEALTQMFNSNQKDALIIKPLIEAAQLLCDLQYTESMKRRSFICASVKKEIKSQLYETEIDSFLFGEKLAETLKSEKAINKSGSEIKVLKTNNTVPVSRSQTYNLNSKSQLATSRQPVKRRQEPAAQRTTLSLPAPAFQQRRRQPPLPPLYQLPPLPPPPPPPQQRSDQRTYQHR